MTRTLWATIVAAALVAPSARALTVEDVLNECANYRCSWALEWTISRTYEGCLRDYPNSSVGECLDTRLSGLTIRGPLHRETTPSGSTILRGK